MMQQQQQQQTALARAGLPMRRVKRMKHCQVGVRLHVARDGF
jgi:hypothetical protein